MRRAAKRDRNHPEIVKALRDAGCFVVDLGAVGNGCPDLLAHGPSYPWRWAMLEIKDGQKYASARKLTPDQVKFHDGCKGPTYVVTSVTQALEVFGL